MSKCLIDGYCECNNNCEIYECEALKMYQKGRIDEQKEWKVSASELLIKYAGDIYEALPDMVEEIQTKAYEKGRVDAIDEFCKKLKEYYSVLSDEMSEAYENTCKTFDKIAEQLKEQKND